MPYENINELPAPVRDGLTADEQRQWLEVFNSVYERTGGDEAAAFQSAWGVVESAELIEVPQKYEGIDLVPPKAAQENARKALRWRDEHGDEVRGGTRVGWTRANQLASGSAISPDVIRRMAQFERHRQNAAIDEEYAGTPWRDAGYVAWLIWGGDEGVAWAQRKSAELKRADEAVELAEEHRRWVPAFALDADVEHPNGAFKTDERFWQAMREGFEKLTQHGYFPPVLRQHDTDGIGKEVRVDEDGFVFGKVIDMQKRDGRYMFQVEVPQAVADAIDEGYIEHWSPSFYPPGWKHPHTGEKLKVAPRHHAFVSVPHQKNLGPGSEFYSLREQLIELQEARMAEGMKKEEMKEHYDGDMGEEKDMQEEMSLEMMAKKVMAIEAMLEDLVGALMERADEEEEVEEDEMPEVGEHEAEIAELREMLKQERRARRADKVRSLSPSIGAKELAEIVELAETSVDAYADRVAELAAGSAPTRQAEIGSQGSASKKSDAQRWEQAITELNEQGVYGAKAIIRARQVTGLNEANL